MRAVLQTFTLGAARVEAILAEGRRRAECGDTAVLISRAQSGRGLSPEGAATLWFARIESEELYQAALAARVRRAAPLETFSPLYMTNTCDAECRMCGMRRDNTALVRETAEPNDVEMQLRTLKRRGMNGVALLTGEYRADRRGWAVAYVNRALRSATDLDFGHILINIGALDSDELEVLLSGVPRRADGAIAPKVTMCTFQETYSRNQYARFMGHDSGNPRADFDRRLANFDRARAAGLRVANPGILIGLNPDLAYETISLLLHARHLLETGMEVYLSVPRLRQTAGGLSPRGASDEEFVRLVSLLALALPEGKIVLTTRESEDVQRKLVPICTVLSAGSASVTPYTDDGARFPLETSQFEVVDQRPFEEILSGHLPERGEIVNFTTPRASRA